MGIPLREVMKIYPFSRSKLIGGAGGLDRMVESANMQEVPHVERWMHPGEILFTAGYAFEGPHGGVQVMERINHLGAAGMAVKPGQYLERVPEEMIACADKLNLPLFELPQDLSYIEHIVPILERISQQQLFQLRRVESIHSQLTQVILQEGGLSGICLTLHQVTGGAAFIFSPEGCALLAYCPSGEDSQEADAEIRREFERRFQTGVLGPLRPNQCNTLRFSGDVDVVCVPIVLHHRQRDCLAYLLLDFGGSPVPETDLMAFEHASSLIAIELLKERAVVEQEQKIREKLLEDLLMKRYGDRQLLHRRGVSAGIDLTRPYCVFIIDPDGFEDYISHRLRGSSEEELQQIKAEIHHMIRQVLESLDLPLLLMGNSVSMVGMLSITQPDSIDRCRRALADVIVRIEKAHPKLYFSAGIGRVKTDVSEAATGLREARLALNCSRLPQYSAGDRVADFGELGPLGFLSELYGSEAMHAFYLEHLGGLLEYDRRHSTELIATLDCFFRCGQNLRKTADQLYIHKNSVIYRIKKIESIINASLTDSQTAFNLQLCLILRNICDSKS